MPLLLIPLLLLPFALAVAWPVLLWWRWRQGGARRPVRGWVLALNAWSLLPALPMLLLGAWLAQRWAPGAPAWAATGVLAGALLAVGSVALTRTGTDHGRRWYTPPRWIALALSLLVLVRVGLWILQALDRHAVAGAGAWWSDRASLFALGGLVLGHAAGYASGLRWRLRG